jgi:hypothetical protein
MKCYELWMGEPGRLDIVITEWALQSYLDLKQNGAFTTQEYKQQLRPDVLLLKAAWPPTDVKFAASKFWGPAAVGNKTVPKGFKMKWHNMGNGKVQIRLCVTWFKGRIFLCQAYEKDSKATDQREIAKFLGRVQMIHQNRHIERGVL